MHNQDCIQVQATRTLSQEDFDGRLRLTAVSSRSCLCSTGRTDCKILQLHCNATLHESQLLSYAFAFSDSINEGFIRQAGIGTGTTKAVPLVN
ncbi:hypothetical protein M0802_008766 [Mischocyttarus mexicanus]|nr:hypothetical protein M0802_008766 [Mischocyttarus mexicanus]